MALRANGYRIVKQLGVGAHGEVILCTKRGTLGPSAAASQTVSGPHQNLSRKRSAQEAELPSPAPGSPLEQVAVKIFFTRESAEKAASVIKDINRRLAECGRSKSLMLEYVPVVLSTTDKPAETYTVLESAEMEGDLFTLLFEKKEDVSLQGKMMISCQLLQCLVCLQAAGILHADIKLENIMYNRHTANGGTFWEIKLADYDGAGVESFAGPDDLKLLKRTPPADATHFPAEVTALHQWRGRDDVFLTAMTIVIVWAPSLGKAVLRAEIISHTKDWWEELFKNKKLAHMPPSLRDILLAMLDPERARRPSAESIWTVAHYFHCEQEYQQYSNELNAPGLLTSKLLPPPPKRGRLTALAGVLEEHAGRTAPQKKGFHDDSLS